MTDEKRIEKYISIVPNERQLLVQDMKFYGFIHYTVNTFTGKEWGNGKESPKVFDPTNQDTDLWCKAMVDAGMKGVILTCKHHDGFCLWQTETTEHSMKNSPYKNGKGDVVREVSESCKKYGLKFGVYLSPWDRNSELYSTPQYHDFYIAQLTELLTNYGEIFMLWLDGACGAAMDGKPVQKYDFDGIWSTALKLQPKICMSGCAPDIRWVGNEAGRARESEWNVVPKFRYELQNIAVNCQQNDDMKNFQKRCEDVMIRDMGSRNFLKDYDEFMWYPSEVDVSIRLGWFYHKIEDYVSLKSLKKLMKIYYGAVGGNSLLLLNIPPNKKGQFCKKDVKRLKQMGDWIRKEESLKIANVEISEAVNTNKGYEISAAFSEKFIDRIRIAEDTTFSQRIESFILSTTINGVEKTIYKGTVVGFNKIAIFKSLKTNNLKLTILECRKEPHLLNFDIFETGAYRVNVKMQLPLIKVKVKY